MNYDKVQSTKYKVQSTKQLSLRAEKGFTLIELSIVIVVIGLIVAGVVGGQSLVAQSKLRGIISDIQKFDVATNAFKLEYNSLPGDLSNASSYWSGTPNGNGNRSVITTNNAGNSHNGEYWWFWVHLGKSASGLLSGAYSTSGVPLTFDEQDIDGLLPKASTGHYWGVHNRTSWKGHQYILGVSDTEWGVYGIKNSLKPKEALSIDTKIDDSVPATGTMVIEGTSCNASICWIMGAGGLPWTNHYTQTPTSGQCTANGAASYDETAQYNVSFDEVNCIPVFRYKG